MTKGKRINFVSLYFSLPHVIHGITTLPSSILLTLTIKHIFAAIPHLFSYAYLCTHPMGDSLHVALTKTLTSKSGTHELADSFPSFQHPV